MGDQRLTAQLSVKAAGPDDQLGEGVFTAYASVFGNVDSYGDVVDQGAFTRTLAEWSQRGDVIPVLWGHDMWDPFANIGGVVEVAEDSHGLRVTGSLDLDNPTAQQVYRLIKGRRTNRMSFAFTIAGSHVDEQTGVRHLTDLDLHEVSIVQVPANELAEITAVKTSAAALAQRSAGLLPEHADALREARNALNSALATIAGAVAVETDGNDDTGQAGASAPAAADSDRAASDEPSPVVPAEKQQQVASVAHLVAAAMATINAHAYGV